MRLSAAHSSRPVARTRFRAARRRRARPARGRSSPTARPSSAGRPSASPFQNGSLPGWPGAGVTSTRSWVMSSIRHDDDAQGEDVADAGLVDHLLVELADPPAGPLARGEEHGVQPAVGDGAAAGDRQPLGARPAGERVADPVPDEAGAQLGELVAGVAPGQHVEHRLEDRARRAWRTASPGAPATRARRRPSRPGRTSRRSAGPARRRGWPARAAPRSTPRASARRRRRSARGRRGTSGRPHRATPRPPGGRRGPRAAARWRRSAATRPGSTRSTAPMSMPSSSELVATTAGSRPALRSSSIRRALLLADRAVVRPGQHRRGAAGWCPPGPSAAPGCAPPQTPRPAGPAPSGEVPAARRPRAPAAPPRSR